MAPPAILPSGGLGAGSTGAGASSSQQTTTAPPVLSRSLQSAIATMHTRCGRVFNAASPLASADLPAANAAVQAVVSDASLAGLARPLPGQLRDVLSAAINPGMQALAKRCHATEHYALLLGWLFKLAPLISDVSIALEWWDFLIKPVLRNPESSLGAVAQARSLVLETMANAPADAYHDVEAPNMPWPKIQNASAGNFTRKVGDAPYTTFASAPAPERNDDAAYSPTGTLQPAHRGDIKSSPGLESSATAFRRRMPPQKNTLYRFTQRLVQLYFAEVASTPHVGSRRTRTRNSSSGTSAGNALSMTALAGGNGAAVRNDATESSKAGGAGRDLSGLGLTGMGADDKLPQSEPNGERQNAADGKDTAVDDDLADGEEEEDEDEPQGSSLCWTQRMEGIVLAYASKAPKRFFHHLSDCFAEPTYRIPVLVNLISFISAHPATAYHLIATPLPAEVLMSLQIDTSTTVVSLGVRLAVMLLPHIPVWFANGGGGGLPALMAIFARIIDWRIFGNGWEERVGQDRQSEDGDSGAGDSALAIEKAGSQSDDGAGASAVSLADEIRNRKAAYDIEWTELDRIGKRLELREDVQWSRLTSKYDGPNASAPDAVLLFTYLYGLFPANTIRFLRAPIDYLRKAHYQSPSAALLEDLIDELTIHERSSDIVRKHRLHEGLVIHDGAEWEVCNTDRWKKFVTEGNAAVCINHYLGASEITPGSLASSFAAKMGDRFPSSGLQSGADTPTGQSEHVPGEAMSLKPLHPPPNLLTPALSISSTKGMSAVHRENLMLRTELNYELNLKAQLLHFIGKLHQNKLKAHILAAEQQNLKSEVKVLRAELDRSLKDRDRIREEADKRAKRLGNPQQKLRQYMEKDRRATEELQRLTVELQNKEETNAALSTQLESVGTELFELKARWEQHEPALRELDALKAHVAKMQESMKAWAENEVRYDAQAAEMRVMSAKWAQMELERDQAAAAAQEAIAAREAAEVERERWQATAEEAAAQLKALQDKWTIKPPSATMSSSGGSSGAHHQAANMTPNSLMHASGAVFTASSPSSPLLQATTMERASRRQSMVHNATARLLAGNNSAATALLNENVRLAGAVEDLQVELLALRAELAVARGAPTAPGGSGTAASASRQTESGPSRGGAALEDVDVLPLDIGPAIKEVAATADKTASPSQAPEYVFTTLRVFGGSVAAEEAPADKVSMTQRLLPEKLRGLYQERARTQATQADEDDSDELVRRVPLLSAHLDRLTSSRNAMRARWPNEWAGPPILSDEDLAALIKAGLREELDRQKTVLLCEEDAAGSGQDLRVRVQVDAKAEVTITSAPTPGLTYEAQASSTAALPTVRLDSESTEWPALLNLDDADLISSLATNKTSRREAYQAAAARVRANYGASCAEDEGSVACFDGLLWTSTGSAAANVGAEVDAKQARRLLTESTIANIVLEVHDGADPKGTAAKFLTPALRRDEVLFLPGLLRSELVRLGLVEEADLPVERVLSLLDREDEGGPTTGRSGDDDDVKPVRLWLCNSLRGLFEVKLVQ